MRVRRATNDPPWYYTGRRVLIVTVCLPDRCDPLTTALTLPVAVLSVLGGAIVAMARSFSYTESQLTFVFAGVVIADSVTFVMCLWYLAQAYHRQTYVFLPLLAEIDRSRDEFLEFAPAMAGGEEEVLEAFEKQMRQRMIDAADRNTQTNDSAAAFYTVRVWRCTQCWC